MKLVIRAFIFHIFCIIVFALIYSQFPEEFNVTEKDTADKNMIDFFLFSTTIQAGVGMSGLYPLSDYTKVAVIVQQTLMLFTHVITLYFFTL